MVNNRVSPIYKLNLSSLTATQKVFFYSVSSGQGEVVRLELLRVGEAALARSQHLDHPKKGALKLRHPVGSLGYTEIVTGL